ncbi:MAG: hypothetical protein EOO91_17510 [Pedobacter sp.]|nr:MAG: hypothetical protein EOO91_17510 [Pedobacter sp.]
MAFKKESNLHKKKTLICLALSLVLAPIFYLFYIKLFIQLITYSEDKKFNKTEWFSKTEERWKMRNDIINNNLLVNKDSVYVKNLIGLPTATLNNPRKWVYNVGQHNEGMGVIFHYINFHTNSAFFRD